MSARSSFRIRGLPVVFMASTLCLSTAAETRGQIPAAVQQQVLAAPGTEVAGARTARVQLVEYFDYNCSFCRKLAPELTHLLATSPTVSITYKEWPIFGGVSVYAAKSALGAQWQNRYLAAHDALMGAPRLTQESQVDSVLQGAGIDLVRLKADLAAHAAEIDALLDRSRAEAQGLGLRGTPGLLVGRNIEMNIASFADLQTAVARASMAP